ncbi:MAG: sugar phosphate isomerase/epimerase [Candidatus Latescibacteria bacterium]|nr:sugar phosphate isomerase/epimerase [Candidatus Latescibacterota bacterium]
MMKLACMSLSFSRPISAGTMTLDSFIDWCYTHKLDGIDLHANHIPSQNPETLKHLKRHCLDCGLPVACLCVSNNYGLPDTQVMHQLEMTKRWIDAALILGASVVRLFAGWTPEGDDPQAAWTRTVRSLREMSAYAAVRGVTVALQNHNHHGLTQVGDDVLRMIAEVNHPNLSHVWDTGQYTDLYPSLEKTVHLARHVRAKIYEIETGEERRLDYTRIFPMLERAGYNGYVSIVYEGQEDERAALPKAVAYLRRFIP